MKKKHIALLSIFFIQLNICPVKLEYKYNLGDILTIESDIAYNIFLNGKYLNKFSSTEISSNQVISKKNDRAKISAALTVVDKGDDFGRYKKSRTYKYAFNKDSFGRTSGLETKNGLHDFPCFNSIDMKIGDSWIAASVFNMPLYNPAGNIKVVLEISYRILGTEKNGNDDIVMISANAVFVKDKNADLLAQYEVFKVAGYCSFLIRFNQSKGVLHSIEETFDYFYVLYDMSVVEVSGTSVSSAKYRPGKDNAVENKIITDMIKFDQSEDINVIVEKDNTIVITLINVQFLSDSKLLLDREKSRLDRVAGVIKDRYKNRRIIVIGHAASTGKPRAELDLSEERAREVLEYLVKSHGFKPEKLSYEGKGSAEPIGDNGTDSGKSMNRRVEIKILSD